MILTIETLFERKGVFYIRPNIPADLKDKARGKTIRLPVGDIFVDAKAGVPVSLRTKDKAEAVRRHATAKAALERYWEALRNGPQDLTQKQVLALAGEMRNAWVKAFDDEPGSPSVWRATILANMRAKLGKLNLLKIPTEDQAGNDMEVRFGPLADAVLVTKGIVTTPETRARLIAEVARAMDEAVLVNWAKATGDYSDSGETKRYPAFEPVMQQAEKAKTAGITFETIIDRKETERAAGVDAKPFAKDGAKKYRLYAASFAAFRKSEDATDVTAEQADDWKRALQATGRLKNRTVVHYIQGLETIIEWGRKQSLGKLYAQGNPVKVVERPQYQELPPDVFTFTRDEAVAVLLAARAEALPHLRWASWLCAYSGARISEIAQLSADNFFQVEGWWFYRLTTMGKKSLKNASSERRVPLHRALIAEGFLDYVDTKSGTERLFIKSTQATVAKWVKTGPKITRAHLKPNHGWRHLFEDMAGIRMGDDAKAYVTGRAKGRSQEKYGKSDMLLPGLAEAMDKIEPLI